MSFFKSSALLGALAASVSLVDAHGYVTGIVADGQYYGGYLVDQYSYTDSPPDVVAWSSTATDLGFVAPDAYNSEDIICHKGSTPGALTASVAAGGTVELQWTEWPESHHGPVLNYLANCNGDCSSVDKTQLQFFKVNQGGLVEGSSPPGQWASDQLIANNQSWSLTIPETLAPGNYVLRHEIIALHSANNDDGAQNYPQCFNIKVTGSGSEEPAGTLGTALYTSTDAGIKVNIYQSLSTYDIPGPALISAGTTGINGDGDGASSGSGSSSTSSSSSSQTPINSPTATATPPAAGTTAPSLPPYPTPTGGSPTGPIGTGTGVPTRTPTPAPSTSESTSTSVVSVTPIPESPSFTLPVAIPSQSEGGQDQGAIPTAGNESPTSSGSSSTPTDSAGSSTGTCKQDLIPDSPVNIPENLSENDLIALMNKVLDRLFTENQHPRQFNRGSSS